MATASGSRPASRAASRTIRTERATPSVVRKGWSTTPSKCAPASARGFGPTAPRITGGGLSQGCAGCITGSSPAGPPSSGEGGGGAEGVSKVSVGGVLVPEKKEQGREIERTLKYK